MAIDTILYIDDSKVLQKKYSQVLQDAGYEVLIASDGQTGIATAESADPSLIILDMLMPGLDGVEVLRRLKPQPQPPTFQYWFSVAFRRRMPTS